MLRDLLQLPRALRAYHRSLQPRHPRPRVDEPRPRRRESTTNTERELRPSRGGAVASESRDAAQQSALRLNHLSAPAPRHFDPELTNRSA